jgi:hypothetical protein
MQNQIIKRAVADVTPSDTIVKVFEGFGFPKFSGGESVFTECIETVFLGITFHRHPLADENGCFFIQKNSVFIQIVCSQSEANGNNY